MHAVYKKLIRPLKISKSNSIPIVFKREAYSQTGTKTSKR